MTVVAATDLQRWLSKHLQDRGLLRLVGRVANGRPGFDILEVKGVEPDTAKVLLGNFPPQLSDDCSGWASVLLSLGLYQPIVDAERMFDLLHDARRIRFCCDTNALAGGVATWLLRVFAGRADLVTSAVVDRELAAWPDRKGPAMWKAKSGSSWSMRTKYRTARRLVEAPAAGVVVDRLSPEQSALVLAKLRDESAAKSPDADMLLIELARGLIRDQPANGRVVYLTGDRPHARAATGALGARNVLYCAADDRRAMSSRGKVRPLGWYNSGGPLGCVVGLALAEIVFGLLTACDVVEIHPRAPDGEVAGPGWSVRLSLRVDRGVPSDWEDPFVEIKELPAGQTQQARSPRAGQDRSTSGSDEAPDAQTSSTSDPAHHEQPGARRTPAILGSGRLLANLGTPVLGRAYVNPRPPIEPRTAPTGLRPQPTIIFARLNEVLAGAPWPPVSSDTDEECRRILVALGAATEDGRAGPDYHIFSDRWEQNDLDWFHSEFLRLPGYRAVADALASGGSTSGRRAQVQLAMARRLGQAAKDRAGVYRYGDAWLSWAALQHFLEQRLPSAGDRVHISDLCMAALETLCITPARFEDALVRFLSKAHDGEARGPRIEPQTSGTVEPLAPETIVVLSKGGYGWRVVDPAGLLLGTAIPYRFLVRVA